MMKKLLIATLLLTTTTVSCTECPPPKNLPDGYTIARVTVQGLQLALTGADTVFEFLTQFIAPEKVAETRAVFLKTKNAVIRGLQVALDGIKLAEEQKAGFDLAKLMIQAEVAWRDLRAFIASLQTPSSQPASRAMMVAISKLNHKAPSVDDLPLTLLQAR